LNVSVILAHPDEGSFNHAIARATVAALERNGHRAVFHDLYAERFDPLLPAIEIPDGAPLPPAIERHCAEIAEADGIVVVHPNWWGQPPAILKGWVDRVIRPGVAYRFLERDLDIFGDPLERLWRDCIFGLCGVRRFRRETFSVVVTSSAEEREGWLKRVGETVERAFPRQE
jgi:NAD(P)H dehydrogenase (quinone)